MQNVNEQRLLQVGFAVICILVLFASLFQGTDKYFSFFHSENFSIHALASIHKTVTDVCLMYFDQTN